jgi:hypothetical protein
VFFNTAPKDIRWLLSIRQIIVPAFMDQFEHHPQEGISNVFGSEAGSLGLNH